MKRIWMGAVIFTSLEAQTLSSLIDHTLQKHPTLHSIEHKLKALQAKEQIAALWPNPSVSVTLNDIRLDKPLDRTLEPMQFTMVSIKQTITRQERLDAQIAQAKAQTQKTRLRLHQARASLVGELKRSAYLYKGLQERLRLLKRYMRLQKEAIAQLNATYEIGDFGHIESVNVETAIAQIKQKIAQVKSAIASARARIRYLTGKRYRTLKIPFALQKLKPLSFYLERIDRSPLVRIAEANADLSFATKALEETKKRPDWYVKFDYAVRAGYADYVSIGAGVSVPLYGREDRMIETAEFEHKSALSALDEVKSSVRAQIETTYAQAIEARELISILRNESIVSVDHMIELGGTTVESGGDPYVYLQLLQRKLSLQERVVEMKIRYLSALAKLDELIGKVR